MPFVSEILMQLAMLDAGIVPFAPSDRVFDENSSKIIDKRIASMTPEQQKGVKRKFRKLWKKAVRSLNHHRALEGIAPISPMVFGQANRRPTGNQKRSRRGVVLWYLKTQVANKDSQF